MLAQPQRREVLLLQHFPGMQQAPSFALTSKATPSGTLQVSSVLRRVSIAKGAVRRDRKKRNPTPPRDTAGTRPASARPACPTPQAAASGRRAGFPSPSAGRVGRLGCPSWGPPGDRDAGSLLHRPAVGLGSAEGRVEKLVSPTPIISYAWARFADRANPPGGWISDTLQLAGMRQRIVGATDCVAQNRPIRGGQDPRGGVNYKAAHGGRGNPAPGLVSSVDILSKKED